MGRDKRLDPEPASSLDAIDTTLENSCSIHCLCESRRVNAHDGEHGTAFTLGHGASHAFALGARLPDTPVHATYVPCRYKLAAAPLACLFFKTLPLPLLAQVINAHIKIKPEHASP